MDYLASLGCHPQSVTPRQYWYLSSLRNERTPSLKINDRLDGWCDFGATIDGDLAELGKHLCRTDSVSEVPVCADKHENAIPVQGVRTPETTPRPAETDTKDVPIVPLQRHALFSYLRSRGIDGDIGHMSCREIHYELRQRRYLALAFGNVAGGYGIHNPYCKGRIRCKNISVIGHSHSEVQDWACIFEGFMDLFSYPTLEQMGDDTVYIGIPYDYLVTNSVNNLKEALEHLQVYEEMHCHLDNDLAGQKAERTVVGIYGKRIHNETLRYHKYKDLNDYLRGKKR